MIERAIILKIQKEQPNVQLFIKLILMINRIYYPQMIAITVFSSTLLKKWLRKVHLKQLFR